MTLYGGCRSSFSRSRGTTFGSGRVVGSLMLRLRTTPAILGRRSSRRRRRRRWAARGRRGIHTTEANDGDVVVLGPAGRVLADGLQQQAAGRVGAARPG